jgi:hypothetical protein
MSTGHPVSLEFYDRDSVPRLTPVRDRARSGDTVVDAFGRGGARLDRDGVDVRPAGSAGRGAQRRIAAVPARRARARSHAPADLRPAPEGQPRSIPPLTAVIPSSAADAVHDAAHATAARFRQGAYSLPCPECRVPAGVLCRARRMHTARRDAYRQNPAPTGPVPLFGTRAR